MDDAVSARLPDIVRDAVLGLVSAVLALLVIGPIGIVLGPVAAAVLGAVWRSRNAALAELRQAELVAEVARLNAELDAAEEQLGTVKSHVGIFLAERFR